MREILFMPKAWQDIGWWMQNNFKVIKKIHILLENTCKSPFEGIGKPEPLKSNYTRPFAPMLPARAIKAFPFYQTLPENLKLSGSSLTQIFFRVRYYHQTAEAVKAKSKKG